jgi:hypothetical protein
MTTDEEEDARLQDPRRKTREESAALLHLLFSWVLRLAVLGLCLIPRLFFPPAAVAPLQQRIAAE